MKRLLVAIGALALIALGSAAQAQTRPVTLKSVKLVVSDGSKIDTTFLGTAILQELKGHGVQLDMAGIDLTITAKQVQSDGMSLSAIGVNKENNFIAVAVSQDNLLFYKQDVIAKVVAKRFADALYKQIGSNAWTRGAPPAEKQEKAITVLAAKK